MRRRDGRLQLTAEHRAAPPLSTTLLELAAEPAPHLHIVEGDDRAPAVETDPHLEERILDALRQAGRPMQREALRETLHARNATLGEALVQLQVNGHIQRANGGFALITNN